MFLNTKYYEKFKENIKIEVSVSTQPPHSYQWPFSYVWKIVGQLSYEGPLIVKMLEQLNQYRNENGCQFIMKRIVTYYTLEEEKIGILKLPKILDHLDKGFKEYYISKMVSAHPAGILPIDFKIVQLINSNCLVTEFLMENAGVALTQYMMKDWMKRLDPVKIFTQISNVMRYMENLQIVYNDVKLGNFLIDNAGNLRVIDYDISQATGFAASTTLTGIQRILGFTDGFVSPEALDFAKRQKLNSLKAGENINPWKADIYSCGVLGLCLTRAIKDNGFLQTLDKYKENANDHKNISDLISKVECLDAEKTKKMKRILESCLDYQPSKRLSFKQLNEVMNSFDKLNYEQVKEYLEKSILVKDLTKQELKKKNEELEAKIKIMEEIQIQNELEITKLKKHKELIVAEYNNKLEEKKRLNETISQLQNELQKIKEERHNMLQWLASKKILNPNESNLMNTIEQVISNLEMSNIKERQTYDSEKLNLLAQLEKTMKKYNQKIQVPKDINQIPQMVEDILNELHMNKMKKENNEKSPQIKEKKMEKISKISEVKKMSSSISKETKKEKSENNGNIKFKNYEDAYQIILNEGKVRKEIMEYVNNNAYSWYLEAANQKEAKKEEIIILMELVKLSNSIEKVIFCIFK